MSLVKHLLTYKTLPSTYWKIKKTRKELNSTWIPPITLNLSDKNLCIPQPHPKNMTNPSKNTTNPPISNQNRSHSQINQIFPRMTFYRTSKAQKQDNVSVQHLNIIIIRWQKQDLLLKRNSTLMNFLLFTQKKYIRFLNIALWA